MNTYRLPEDTTFDRIKQHYLTGYELSDLDEEQRKRWESAHSLILDKATDREAAKMHSELYGISIRQAYIDIGNAKNLFGDIRKTSKEGYRYLVSQWATELLKKAEAKGEYDACAKALEKIIKANNLDKEDQDLPDPSKIQPPVQLLSINFNIINSPRFKLIDKKAQEGLLELYNQFMKQIENSPMRDYLDLFQDNTYELSDGD